jgi:hypothetical protein
MHNALAPGYLVSETLASGTGAAIFPQFRGAQLRS